MPTFNQLVKKRRQTSVERNLQLQLTEKLQLFKKESN